MDRTRRSTATRARAIVGGAALTTIGIALAGCSAMPSQEPEPARAEATAAVLASGLSRGDLDGVAFTEVSGPEATADYAEVVSGLGDITPTVQVEEVVEDGDTAVADLAWSWPVSAEDVWSYSGQATLRRTGEEWAVEWGHSVVEPSLNAASVLDRSTLAGSRADIIGADGAKLVTERPVARVGIDRGQVPLKKAGAAATRLARLVDVDVTGFRKRVVAAGERAFVEAITYRADDVPPAVSQGYPSIPGAILVATELPLAPTRTFAAPLLGTVGEVTAEMIADDPERYRVGDVAGLSGLQARYDDQLRGSSGVVVNAVGSDGKERELARFKATNGTVLRLTLDQRLQTAAEALLAEVGPASSLVAIRPSTGAILAAANGPGNGGQNLATFGQYAPGSTFKSVSALALLRRGLKPDSTVDCTARIVVDGKPFENYDDYPPGGHRADPVPHGAGQLLQHRLHRRTDPPGDRRPVRRRSLPGARGRPRPRFPGVLRLGRPAADRDRTSRRHDRPGHRAGLADGDGRGDGLDPGRRPRGAAPGPAGRGLRS